MIRKIKDAAEGKKSGFLYKIILLPLWPLSLLYGFIVTIKAWLFEKGVLLRKELPCKVICVGNITTGGTGKTPGVIKIAGILQSMEKKVAIVSRGYGGSYEGVKIINPDLDEAAVVGDEPLLMARQLNGVPVVVSRDRHKGGSALCRSGRYDYIILDDGFQHLRLKRDLDLVLIDSNLPFGNGHLLPMGILREPLSALKRGNAFMLTKVNMSSKINNLCVFLSKRNSEAPIFKSSHKPAGLKVLKDGDIRDETVDFIKGKKIIAFAGIANPDSFFEMITGMGGIILSRKAFDDHEPFDSKDLDLLDEMAVRENSLRQNGKNNLLDRDVASRFDSCLQPETILMTTEKDLMRLGNFRFRSVVAVLKIEFSIEREDEFIRFITGQI